MSVGSKTHSESAPAAGYAGVPVLLLGANGFIGRWLARQLEGSGARVTLAVREAGKVADTERVRSGETLSGRGWGDTAEVDLSDFAALEQLVARVAPAVVFNLAGYGVDRSEQDEALHQRLNAELLRPLVEAVARIDPGNWSGQRIVHAGTALEYGEAPGDLAEETRGTPRTRYGRSKLAGTEAFVRACEDRSLAGVTARLFNVYGAGEHPGRLLPSLLEAALGGGSVELTAGSQRHDFTYVEDVAEGFLRLGLSTAERGEIINLATGVLTSVREFCETAARVLALPEGRLRFGAIGRRATVQEVPKPVAIERLRRRTGWVPPTTIEAGLERALRFARRDRDLARDRGGVEA